jgi:peptidoglycan-N-acetylglucosamine deacetylase
MRARLIAHRAALLAVLAVLLVGGAVAGVLLADSGDAPPAATSTTSTTAEPDATTTSTQVPTTPTTVAPTTTDPPPTSPPTSDPGGEPAVALYRGAADDQRVALTFDAGSDVGHTSRILDILGANGIRASFGITGRWAEANPGLVARIADEGHVVINHSYDHPSFTGFSTGAAPLGREQRLDQLARADAAIAAATGTSSRPWFRPPFGDEDASVRADVGVAGYRYEVMWTVDSLGWQGLPVAEVTTRCLDGAEPGAIYLFHVGSESTDADALQAIVDGLRARGLGFATVAELV